MALAKIIVAISLVAVLGLLWGSVTARPGPDSAGIVPMVNGLAYGGIPYGSVSGRLADTIPAHQSSYYLYAGQQHPSSPLLVSV